MIKQILVRLSRKPSKSSENREFGGSSAPPLSNPSHSRSSDIMGNHRLLIDNAPLPCPNSASTFGYSHLSRLSQVVDQKLNGNSRTAPYEALPGMKDVPRP
ncbi:hypothetical protein ES332_A11G321700v1 [Gossypium tomentosum]|uniref:Uncharacterized protein n=1 Tax=Gossypium tomentosum TaxID=34277 RepID=A0A5D2NJI6_GOSTO|nr:hypothetical protein ES332_A11G321700v1 [Gossypium tomentosum]